MATTKSLKIALGGAIAAFLISSSSPTLAAEIPDTLRIGLLPTEDNIEMIKQFKGIADHLGKEMNLPTKIWVSQSYNALIEAMGAGKLELSYVGGGQYVAALKQKINVVPIVVTKTPAYVGDTKGRTYYKSAIVTRTETGIKTLQDIKGKNFAFVSPTSTSGGIAPRFVLLNDGINPEKDLKNIYYAGSHEAVFLAVMNKKVDAGAMADHYFHRYKKRGMLEFKEYDEPNNVLKDSVLHIVSAQKVPGTPIIVRGDLGPAFIKKLRAAFLSLPPEALGSLKFWGKTLGFKSASHEDYEDVVAMKKLAAEMKKKQKKKK